jgi:CRISPR/Cas system CSM-associated protein Csm3 (group 7 of RAMP superfamily)
MMFRRSYNRALLHIKLTTVTPLLIRAGDTGLSPTASDLSCVRTHHGVHGRTVYIPGSSLKGVTRQAAEASVRGTKFHGIEGACDPLSRDQSCWSRVEEHRRKQSTAKTYADLCLACRTFGSLALKGHTSVRDLFPWDDRSATAFAESTANASAANRVEIRHGVAIHRITGSVEHGPFDQEIVPAGVSFWGEIAIENFQMWQFGLVARAIDELDSGFARLGSGTTRGLGEVRAVTESIVYEQVFNAQSSPAGIGVLATPEEKKHYQLITENPLSLNDPSEQRGLSRRFVVTDRARVTAWSHEALGALGALA